LENSTTASSSAKGKTTAIAERLKANMGLLHQVGSKLTRRGPLEKPDKTEFIVWY